jgi:hypothetical protein
MKAKHFLSMAGLILASASALAQTPAGDPAQVSALQPIRTAQAGTIAPPRAQDPDPLLDLPPVSQAGATLVGGIIEKLDRVRDRIVIKPFGGGQLDIAFDPRTKIVRGEQKVGARDLKVGERVHIETVTDGPRIFAKKIHIGLETAQGEAHGQVVSYDVTRGEITINDELSSQPVRFHVDKATKLSGEGLQVGSLVDVNFLAGTNRASAREVKVLAAPGSLFTFSGNITYLDLASHSLVVASSTDDKKYPIKFDPQRVNAWERLHEGTNVLVKARFDGQNYTAEEVTVMSAAAQ